MPIISVIVPVYNIMPWLPACVDSLLAQTLSDFELLLVDDGSTDGSAVLCESYAAKDARVQVLHKANGGLSSARNAGLDAAQGAYIAFVDGDDFVKPTFLHALYEAAQRADADMALCAIELVDENGARLTPRKQFAPRRAGTFSGQQLSYAFYEADSEYYTVAWNKLYRAELWRTLRYPEGRIHEDDAVAHRLYWDCGAVACCTAPLICYRQRAGSICHTSVAPSAFDGVTALVERCRFYEQKNAARPLRQAALAAAWRRYLFVCGQAKQAPDASLLARWRTEQARMRSLVAGLPACSGLTLKEKLSGCKWVLTPPEKLAEGTR